MATGIGITATDQGDTAILLQRVMPLAKILQFRMIFKIILK